MCQNYSVRLAHHHTAICVSNWETSVAFYEQLGFTVINDWYWPDGVKNHKSLLRFDDRADCWLELFEYPNGKGKLTEAYTASAGCVYRFAMETLEEAGVDQMYDHALLAGGGSVQPPHNVSLRGNNGIWRYREACVAGPDGEQITFLYDWRD